MSKTPEAKVKSAITKYLISRGYYYFSAVAGPYSVHGVPDLIVCAKGRFVGIECKAPGKEKNTTPNQDAHIQRITTAGGLAFVASSVEDVKTFFEANGL